MLFLYSLDFKIFCTSFEKKIIFKLQGPFSQIKSVHILRGCTSIVINNNVHLKLTVDNINLKTGVQNCLSWLERVKILCLSYKSKLTLLWLFLIQVWRAVKDH
jgi:hypothetical protein